MAKKTVIDSLRHSAIETSLAVAAATTGFAGCSPEPSTPAAPATSVSSVTSDKVQPTMGTESKRGAHGNTDLNGLMQRLVYAASQNEPFDEKLAKETLSKAIDAYAHAARDQKAEINQEGISYYRKVMPDNKLGHTSSVVIINPEYQSLAVFNNIQYAGIDDPVLDMSSAKRVGAVAKDPEQHIEQTYAETAALLQRRNEGAAAQQIRDTITRTRDIAKLPQRYIDMLAGDKEAVAALSIGSGVSADFAPAPMLNNFIESYSSPVAIRRVGNELIARVQDIDSHTWTDAGKVNIAPKQPKGFGERVNESRNTQGEMRR